MPRTVTAPASHTPDPPPWVSGLLAGVQGALLSLLTIVLPALAAFVATSADPSNADVGWPRAAGVGAALWLMGHGLPMALEGASITLVPLGVTGLALFGAYASARRSARPARSAWLAGVAGHAGVVALTALLVVRGLAAVPDVVGLGRLAVGAVVVPALGLAWGMFGAVRLRTVLRPLWARVHPLVRSGAVAGVVAVGVLVVLAAVVTVGWVVSRRAPAGDVIAGLGVDTFGGLIMAAAQLAVAPNLVLWFLAWLVGPGFAVGAGTSFAPDGVVSGPLPALPMLAALPESGSGGGLMSWVPVVTVLAGGLAGWWLHRRLPDDRAREPVLGSLVCAGMAGLAAAALTLLAGGGAGPGRLAVVGGPVLEVGAVVTALVLTGCLLVAVPASGAVRSRVARALRDAWSRLRGGDVATATVHEGPPAPDET